MRQGKIRFIIGFLTPPLTIYILFVIWPYIQTFQLSLTRWDGQSAPTYIGLENFKNLFDDDGFMGAIGHHITMLIALPLVTLGLALFFSFWLNLGGNLQGGQLRGVRGSSFYKVVFFLPQVLAVAIVAVLFSNVYQLGSQQGGSNPPGMINGVLQEIHHKVHWVNQVGFLTDPKVALWAVIGVMVWQAVGFYVVLFSAGMASIPKDLFEAAALDGASRATLFFKITLPLLFDTVQVGWIYLSIAAFDGFALVQVMEATGGAGPENSTTVLPLLIYNNSVLGQKSGYAAAMGVVLFGMTILVSALIMIVSRLYRRESIEF